MDVTKRNLEEAFRLLQHLVETADFIAFDCEFTGLAQRESLLNAFDTPEERYVKVKQSSLDFLLIQVGICTFKKTGKNKYEIAPFSFTVFPSREKFFTCQSTSLYFLANQGFDFNKLLLEGIPYVTPADRDKVPITPDEPYDPNMKAALVELKKKLDGFATSEDGSANDADEESPGSRNSMEIECQSPHLRRHLYHYVETRYPSVLSLENDAKKKRMVAKRIEQQDECIRRLNKEGFSYIMRMLSDSGRVLIGHNCFLDICHLLNEYLAPLPETYGEFKQQVTALMPRFIDTKVMASTAPLKDLVPNSALGELHQKISQKPFSSPTIEFHVAFKPYDRELAHDAGYDAYMTGCCFAALTEQLSKIRSSADETTFDSELVKPFLQKVFFLKQFDIPYLNLGGSDLAPTRDHVFFVTVPDEKWRTNDVKQVFNPFGDSFVGWIDHLSAFVALRDRSKAAKAYETLKLHADCRVMLYNDYRPEMKRPAPADPDPLAEARGKRQRPSAEEPAETAASNGKAKPQECNGVCQPLKTFDQLLQWQPVNPLRAQLSFINRKRQGGPQLLLCHDYKGGYLADRFNNGTEDEDYRFFHWHLVDLFVYFSHHLVTIPPAGWIHAAHLHGVPCLGTFITEWDDGVRVCNQLLQPATWPSVADKLVAIATRYGFDGWLVNIENVVQADQMSQLVEFVKYLTKASHASNPHAVVVWYDSVVYPDGELQWQNELNDLNRAFFDACDAIFLNYTWKEENLQRSAQMAASRKRQVFVGVDVFGRGCLGGGGFHCDQALDVISKYGMSTAVFAPGWTYETLPAEDFLTNNHKFWKQFEPFFSASLITELPIQTSLCQGCGKSRFENGTVTSDKAWYCIGSQQLQPNVPGRDDLVPTDETAFSGSSCWKIIGEKNSKKEIDLFLTDIRLHGVFVFRVTTKYEKDVTLSLYLDDSECLLYAHSIRQKENGWKKRAFYIHLDNADRLKRIAIVVRFGESTEILIGHLEVVKYSRSKTRPMRTGAKDPF